jgi:pimeloyl-ACP methyl ester carboxylesterase
MDQPILRKVKGHNVQIQVAIWEGNQENSVLCIHGLAANCRSWDTIGSALAPSHHLIAMDLRGRGTSERPVTGYSIDNHVEDVRNVLDDLGVGSINLMGHSFGTVVSMVFAAKYPTRAKKLILIDGGGQLSEEEIQNIMPIVQLPLQRLEKVYPSKEEYLKQIKDKGFLKPWPHTIETMYLYDLEPVEGGVTTRTKIACIQEDIGNVKKYPLHEIYPRVTQPVLIMRSVEGVFSDKDIVIPDDAVKKMTQALPNARSVDVPGTNHFSIAFMPNPERDRMITTFLKK